MKAESQSWILIHTDSKINLVNVDGSCHVRNERYLSRALVKQIFSFEKYALRTHKKERRRVLIRP